MSRIPPELSFTGENHADGPNRKGQAFRLVLNEGGFTQAWNTVGAGDTIPRRRELDLGERTFHDEVK